MQLRVHLHAPVLHKGVLSQEQVSQFEKATQVDLR